MNIEKMNALRDILGLPKRAKKPASIARQLLTCAQLPMALREYRAMRIKTSARDSHIAYYARLAARREGNLRRAIADPDYRAGYLADLDREYLCRYSCAHTPSAMAAWHAAERERSDWLSRANAARSRIGVERYSNLSTPINLRCRLIGIPIAIAQKTGAKICRRGYDWEIAPTLGPSHLHHVDGDTDWRHGRPRNYTRAVNVNYIQSYGVIVSESALYTVLHGRVTTVTLPKNYHWDIDNLGIRAVSSDGDDYHINQGDCALGSDHIVAQLQSLADVRRAKKQKEGSEKLAYEVGVANNVAVCLMDSRGAGNCLEGSRAWARHAELRGARHIGAQTLARLGADDGRVRAAIIEAAQRQAREIARGYSDLAYHCLVA